MSTKKKRKHAIRNGKPDPTTSRLSWGKVNPVTRVLPNKKREMKNNE